MDERERLIEEATSAHRTTDPGGAILPHPAWCDLAPDDRRLVYEETVRQRDLEAALDPEGLTTTVRAVLARIRG
jgi:hypothetical protein